MVKTDNTAHEESQNSTLGTKKEINSNTKQPTEMRLLKLTVSHQPNQSAFFKEVMNKMSSVAFALDRKMSG